MTSDLTTRASGEHIKSSFLTFSGAWSFATALILVVLIARIVYLVWLSPYQLVGDESYYWEQARHLDLSYDEKGPLLAWMIAGCCKLFGDTEWAVRLPVAIFSAISAWAVGLLAMSFTRDSSRQRVGLFAVIIFLLLPAFQANAQICTQDGPLIAVWIALTAIGLRLLRRMEDGHPSWGAWLLFWAVMGIGVLLKQSVLLFLLSFPVYAIVVRPRHIRWGQLVAQQIVGCAIFALIVSPMIIWDARHGWPMLAHTLGHLGAGGDQAGHVNSGNAFIWLGNTLGGIVGAFGPAFVALMIWACVHVWRIRKSDESHGRDGIWLMCAALPSTAFFILLSLHKPVVPSWPLPAIVSLVPLVAELASDQYRHYHERIDEWRSRSRQEPKPKKPDTPFHQLWVVLLIYGIAGQLLLAFPNALAYTPFIGKHLEHSVLKRFSGHREDAAELQRALATITTPDGRPPVIVARHYMQAGLYSFYLRTHPSVCTAGKYLGKRATTFDKWADTDLSRPEFRGRTLLLDGQGDVPWDRALIFDQLIPIDGGRFYLATNFQGPRPDHPTFLDD
jgi:4-amino-4-deoxy-L-arabinose transferase-like glycosyltransferase